MTITEFIYETIDQEGNERRWLVRKGPCHRTGKPYMVLDLVGRLVTLTEKEDIARLETEARQRLGL